MCAILALMILLWPVQALVRRRYGQAFPLAGRDAMLYRAVRLAAICDLAALAGYVVIAQSANTNIGIFDDPLDPWLRVLQVLCLLGVVGAALGIWNTVRVWGASGRSWWAKTSVTITTLALIAFVWFVVSLQLVTASLNY